MKYSSFWTTITLFVLILLSVFIIVFIGSITNSGDNGYSCVSEKIKWETYKKGLESIHLASQKCVFLFVYPELSPSSLFALDRLSTSTLKQLCGNREYIPLLLKYDNWNDPGIRHIAQTVGFSKEPFIIFYLPDGKTIALDPFSLKKIDFGTVLVQRGLTTETKENPTPNDLVP